MLKSNMDADAKSSIQEGNTPHLPEQVRALLLGIAMSFGYSVGDGIALVQLA